MTAPCSCYPAPSHVTRKDWPHDYGLCEFPTGVIVNLDGLSALDRFQAERHNRHVRMLQISSEARRQREARTAELCERISRDPDGAACQWDLTETNLAITQEQRDASERQARQAIREAYEYRRLWEVAADCLRHNAGKLAKPRGGDERRMLAHAAETLGTAGGETDGWLDWLPDVEPVRRLDEARTRRPTTDREVSRDAAVLDLFSKEPTDV